MFKTNRNTTFCFELAIKNKKRYPFDSRNSQKKQITQHCFDADRSDGADSNSGAIGVIPAGSSFGYRLEKAHRI